VMHNVLIFAPSPMRPSLQAIYAALEAAGYSVVGPDLDGPEPQALESLQRAFSGRPPHVLIADLSSSPDCLPLRRLDRLLHDLWGEEAPMPLRLALLCPASLLRPDWLAAVDDFL